MSVRLKPADRRYFIGGSDARIIMGDDEAALIRLWREKRGEVEPEDLSGNLIVQLGLATEELNRRWYEANSGQVITDVQRQVRHPTIRWMAATPDGGELVLAQIFPDIFDRVEFRRVGRQMNQRDVFWDREFAGDMPSSSIQNERRVTALGNAT